MNRLRERERIHSRVLGALRFVDAGTGAAIPGAMRVEALDGNARLVRNGSGLLVISQWSPLGEHRDAFPAPPAEPDVGSLSLRLAVDDPSGRYLPRLASLALPRDPDPANREQSDSLFRPVEVPMYPSAAAAIGGNNWSLLRVSLSEQASGDRLGGALLRVHRNGEVIARGLTDWRGEALVMVVGVPVMSFGDDDAVVVAEIGVQLEAVFDPDAGQRTPAAALEEPHRPCPPLRVDPSALEAAADLPSATTPLAIAARRSRHVALSLELQ